MCGAPRRGVLGLGQRPPTAPSWAVCASHSWGMAQGHSLSKEGPGWLQPPRLHRPAAPLQARGPRAGPAPSGAVRPIQGHAGVLFTSVVSNTCTLPLGRHTNLKSAQLSPWCTQTPLHTNAHVHTKHSLPHLNAHAHMPILGCTYKRSHARLNTHMCT